MNHCWGAISLYVSPIFILFLFLSDVEIVPPARRPPIITRFKSWWRGGVGEPYTLLFRLLGVCVRAASFFFYACCSFALARISAQLYLVWRLNSQTIKRHRCTNYFAVNNDLPFRLALFSSPPPFFFFRCFQPKVGVFAKSFRRVLSKLRLYGLKITNVFWKDGIGSGLREKEVLEVAVRRGWTLFLEGFCKIFREEGLYRSM